MTLESAINELYVAAEDTFLHGQSETIVESMLQSELAIIAEGDQAGLPSAGGNHAAGSPDPHGPDGGFALVAVLWFMMVVAAIAIPFAVAARTQAMVQGNLYRLDRLDLLATGLADIVSSRVFAASDNGAIEAIPLDGREIRCRSGRLVLTARAQEHAGLIDLNAAEPPLLAFGFGALGLDEGTAKRLAEAVMTYRSPRPSTGGSYPDESDVYGGFKNARIEAVSELSDFARLRGIPSGSLMAVFTTHSRTGSVVRFWMPAGLAGRSAEGDSEAAAFFVDGSARSNAVTVEVWMQEVDHDAAGYAGFVVLGGRRVEALPRPLLSSPGPTSVPCSSVLGAAVAQALGDWT